MSKRKTEVSNMSKGILAFLMMILVISLTGCTKPSTTTDDSPESKADNSSASQKPVKLTITTLQADGGGNVDDVWLWPFLEWKFNVELDVIQIASEGIEERKSIMFATDRLSDIMINMSITSSEMVRYGQQEQQLYAYNDIITPELMPNLSRWLEENPEAAALSTAPDGNMYSLPGFNGFPQEIGQLRRYFIRQDLLESTGMETPETLDELTAFLIEAKKLEPDLIPLGGTAMGSEGLMQLNLMDPRHYILNAFGFNIKDGSGKFVGIRNDEVVIPAFTDVYEDYLEVVKMYFDEGLISKDFFTLESATVKASIAAQEFAIIPEPAYLTLPEAEDYENYWAVKPLTSKWNDTPQWLKVTAAFIGGVVSGASNMTPEKEKAIASILDYWYDDEGYIQIWCGPMQGDESELGIIDGWYVDDQDKLIVPAVEKGEIENEYLFSKAFISPFDVPRFGIKNPIDFHFRPNHVQRLIMAGVEVDESELYDLSSPDDHYRASVYENIFPHVKAGYPETIYFTEEDTIKMNELASVINPHIDAETAKFITGARPLSEFDTFQEELKAFGIEEYLEYYKKAYNPKK